MRPFEVTLEAFLVHTDRVKAQGEDAYYIDPDDGRKTLWPGTTDPEKVLRSQHARSILDVMEGIEQGQLDAGVVKDHPAIVQMQLMKAFAKLRKAMGSTPDSVVEHIRMAGTLAGYLSPASNYEDPINAPEGREAAINLLERFREDARLVMRRQGKPEAAVEQMAIVRMAAMSLDQAQVEQAAEEVTAEAFQRDAIDLSGNPVMLVWDSAREGMRRVRHEDGSEVVVANDSLDFARDPERMTLAAVTPQNVGDSGWSSEDIFYYAERLKNRGGVPESVALAWMSLEGHQRPSAQGRVGHPQHGTGHWSVFYPEQGAWVGQWQSVENIDAVQQEALLLEAKALAERSGYEMSTIGDLEGVLDSAEVASSEVVRGLITDMAVVMRSMDPQVHVAESASAAMALFIQRESANGFDLDAALAELPPPPVFVAGETVWSGDKELRVIRDAMEGDDLVGVMSLSGVREWVEIGKVSRAKPTVDPDEVTGRVGDFQVRFERNEEDTATRVRVLLGGGWIDLGEDFKALRPSNKTLLPMIEALVASRDLQHLRRDLRTRITGGTLEVNADTLLRLVEGQEGTYTVSVEGERAGTLVGDDGARITFPSQNHAVEHMVETAIGIQEGNTPLLSTDEIWTGTEDLPGEVQEQPFPEVRAMMEEYHAYRTGRTDSAALEAQRIEGIVAEGGDPYEATTEAGEPLMAMVAGHFAGQLNPEARREREGLTRVLAEVDKRKQVVDVRSREFLDDGRWKAWAGDEVYLSIDSEDAEVPVHLKGAVKADGDTLVVEVVNFAEASALLPIERTYTYTRDWTVQGDPQVAARAAEAIAAASLKRLAILPEQEPAASIVQTFRDMRSGRGYEVVSEEENVVVLRADDGEVLKESREDFLQFYSRYRKVARAAQSERGQVSENERDFYIESGAEKTPRGSVARIRANIAAIKLVKQLEADGRMATPDEKTILGKYSGWGADKEVFNEQMASYRDNMWMQGEQYESWEKRYGKFYDQLKELLTKREWDAAKASTLNAHYTSEEVSSALWDIARKAGFRGGHVLDPGAGTGNLFATMPRDLHSKSTMTGVELDSITGMISFYLYPQADIHITGFQDAPIKNGSVDLVVANVPFSENGPAGQPKGEEMNLHNWFISESMDKLKPGGLAVVITSGSTLENNPKQRELLAEKSQFMGAIRLPNDAFKGNTNTEVVTDILVLRKANHQAIDSEAWTRRVPVQLSEAGTFTTNDYYRPKTIDNCEVNEYFYAHPEQVLGFHSLNGSMYGASKNGQYTVESPKGAAPIAERLAGAIANLPANVMGTLEEDIGQRQGNDEELTAFADEKVGSFVMRNGNLYQVTALKTLGGLPWETDTAFKFPRGFNEVKALDMLQDFVRLRERLERQIRTDLNTLTTEGESEVHRSNLRDAYTAYTAKWGKLNDNPSLYRLLKSDPMAGSVFALERVSRERGEDGKTRTVITDAAILNERTLFPSHDPQVTTIEEAIAAAQAERGYPDVHYMAELLGKEEDIEGVKATAIASGRVFEDPKRGTLVSRTRYLSGNVSRKLREARRAATDDPRFEANVEELEKVQPTRIPFDQISVNLSSSWVDPEIPSAFAREILRQPPKYGFEFVRVLGKWVPTDTGGWSQESSQLWGTQEMDGKKIFEHAINGTNITIKSALSDGTSYEDPKASAQANEMASRIREEYIRWIKDNPKYREAIENAYNERLNNMVVPAYDGGHLTFPGISRGSGSMTPRKHQSDVVARIIEEQSGMIAHEVGYGKTFELILAAYESKRLGLCNKPMVICDNPSYPQFVQTVREVYPQANILVSDEASMSKRNRNQFLSSIASERWDFVIVPQSHFDMMPVSAETEIRYISTELEELEEGMRSLNARSNDYGNKRFVRQLEKKKESLKVKLMDLQKKAKQRHDDGLCFEQLGVDMLFIDEAHKYKKMPFNTAHTRVKGIDTGQSQRGMNLLMKARYIQDRRDGAGVVAATATPVTNTMAEAWNMIRLTQPNTLKEFGCTSFDEFLATFTTQETAMELNESNNKWRNVTRLAKFINGPTFIDMVRSAFDVQMDKEAVGLDLPERKGGEVALKVIEQTDEVADLMEGIADIYEAYEKSSCKKEISYVPIMLMQVSMAASIDPRLINPEAQDDPTSLVNRMVGEVKRIYDETASQKGTQALFLDRYRPMDTSILEEVKEGGLDAFRAGLDTSDAEITIREPDAEDDEELEEMRKELIAHRKAEDTSSDRHKRIMKMSREEVEKAVSDIGFRKKFNLYNEIRDKLVALGIPRNEVAIINECRNAAERKDLFDRINSGKCRVVMGSTQKLGTGVNIQRRLAAMHHVDPARDLTPASMNQRSGRGIRQGNIFDEVEEIYYGMKDTAVPGIYHRIQRKAAFIGQALAGKGVGMEFEDCSEVRLEEMKSSLISDKRQIQRAELLAQIKDEKMQAEVVNEAIRRNRTTISDIESRLERSRQSTLPRAEQLREYAQEHYCGYAQEVEREGKTVEVLTAELPDGEIFEGGRSDLLDKLNKHLKEFMDIETPRGQVNMKAGTLRLGGMTIDLTVRPRYLDGSGGNVIEAFVANPLGTGHLSDSKVHTGAGLLKVYEATREYMVNRPGVVKKIISEDDSVLKKLVAKGNEMQAYDMSRVEVLQGQLRVLEADMRDNPIKKRRRRGEAEEEALEVAAVSADSAGPLKVEGKTPDI